MFKFLIFFCLLCFNVFSETLENNSVDDESVNIKFPTKTRLSFSGIDIEGELKNPNDFYFEHRPEEKFNSLIQRPKDFRKQILRDIVQSK